MENQTTTLDKAVKVSIIAGALIVALSIAYYLVIFLPQREKRGVEQQKQEQQAKYDAITKKENELTTCLIKANSQHAELLKKVFSGSVEDLNRDNQETKNLRRAILESSATSAKEAKAECYKRYPQN